MHALPSPSNHVNWAGFYVRDETASDQLILGPFQGKVACQIIRFGKGVCGAAAESKVTQLVPDVDKFPGHITCDGDSKSEIVVPMLKGGKVSVCCAGVMSVVAVWWLMCSRSSRSLISIARSRVDSIKRTSAGSSS